MSNQKIDGVMRSYRVMTTDGARKLRMVTEDIPSVQRGEVLVQVKASSLNYRDLAMIKGEYPGEVYDNLIPVSDAAGEIVAVGEGVRRFQVGDRVAGNFTREWFGGKRPDYLQLYGSNCEGWLTEYRVLNPELLVSIPSHLTYEQAATLPCAAVTAWSALHGPNPLSPGDTVLTLGSGGVSVFAIQFAKLLGLHVISTTSNDKKAERLKALGADRVINYRTTPNWGKVAKELTGGKGVNRVVEVGGPATIHQSLQAIAPGEEITLIGFLAKGGDKIDYFDLFGKASIRTVRVGSRNDFESMNRLIEDRGLISVVDSVFPFEEVEKAFAYLESQKFFGKIVISHQ
ncbi:MAG: NAD(P)-dependent alcohol dehydrogenase [Sporolactobacillus sp.]